MSDIPFYRTQIGHHFFEATLPELVKQITRLNNNLERLTAALDSASKPSQPESTDLSKPT